MNIKGIVWVGTATDKYDEMVGFFKDTLGLEVFEVGHEHEGCGSEHPKLHPSFRKNLDVHGKFDVGG